VVVEFRRLTVVIVCVEETLRLHSGEGLEGVARGYDGFWHASASGTFSCSLLNYAQWNILVLGDVGDSPRV